MGLGPRIEAQIARVRDRTERKNNGWLTDRVDSRLLLFWYYGLRGLSLCLSFAFDMTFYGLSLFAIFYGLDWIATVPPTLKLAERAFGCENAAVMFGWILAAHQIGAAAAAWGAGYLRTVTGKYASAFWTSGLICLVAAAALLLIGQSRTRVGVARQQVVD